ncbi:MAG: ABC transporter ATP-binding protein [Stackebrandtia sp.]
MQADFRVAAFAGPPSAAGRSSAESRADVRPADLAGTRPSAVEVRGLRRTFVGRDGAERTGLDGVDMTVRVGEVRGLLGPNGAGKTTICRVLATILLPTAGVVKVFGRDVVRDAQEIRRSTGLVLGGDRGLYRVLTARQNVVFWARLHGLRGRPARLRAAEVLDRVGLGSRAEQPVQRMSRGMVQRVHLARALVSGPRLLVLDEPTNGMDPVAAQEFRALVEQLRADGCTVLLTTHNMAEAEQLCDVISLISDGRVLATEQPRELGRAAGQMMVVQARNVPADLLRRFSCQSGVSSVRAAQDGAVRIGTSGAGVDAEVVSRLQAAGVTEFSVSRPTVEEVYLQLFGARGMGVSA